jgi:hypothetical protein
MQHTHTIISGGMFIHLADFIALEIPTCHCTRALFIEFLPAAILIMRQIAGNFFENNYLE